MKIGIPSHLKDVIKELYEETKIQIKQRELVKISGGVRQGCPLSTTLFNLYLNDMIQTWKQQITGGINLGTLTVKTLAFADDQILIAKNEDELQRMLYKLNIVAKTYNMEISPEKTKVMTFKGSHPVRSKIILENKTIEQVSKFNYLGCDISFVNEIDVNNKINKFSYITGTLKRSLRNKARKDSIMKLYKTMAVPTITYGSETWTMTAKHTARIQTAEMNFLRPIAGYQRIDRKQNKDIRQQLNIEELNTTIAKYRTNWKQHLIRMTDDRIPKAALNYKPRGRRGLGRPRKRWEQQFGAGTG